MKNVYAFIIDEVGAHLGALHTCRQETTQLFSYLHTTWVKPYGSTGSYTVRIFRLVIDSLGSSE